MLPAPSRGSSYSISGMTAPIQDKNAAIPSSSICFLKEARNFWFSFSRIMSYRSSQSVVVISNPSFFNAVSIFRNSLTLTSPEPVPPFFVCLAPFPYKAIGSAHCNGNEPSDFKRTIHSGTIFLNHSRLFSSPIFLLLPSETYVSFDVD